MFMILYLIIVLLIILSPLKHPITPINDNSIELFYKKYSSILILIISLINTRKLIFISQLLILFIPLPSKKFFSGHVYKITLSTYFLSTLIRRNKYFLLRSVTFAFIIINNFYLIRTILYFHHRKELIWGWIIGSSFIIIVNYIIN